GAAACSLEGELLASTAMYPSDFPCRWVFESVRPRADSENGLSTMNADLPGGRVHLSAMALSTGGTARGFVVLVHDLSYLGRREATTRNILLAAFIVLALGASAITMFAGRIAFRAWTSELRRALSGQGGREFQPLIGDVCALVERLVSEREREGRVGPWSPERLRSTL